jgi:soluble epoxide hydrolase/lipid-phosphate phosphatase
MALSTFPQLSKSVELGDGTRYTYAYAAPATSAQATFLFLHGFPSSSHDWRHQIEFLKSKGYGILAPDLLGYGDTDGPAAVEAYSMKRMSDHLAGILAKENVKQVIAVGHDW